MTERRGYRLKKIGVKAGCPDILIQRPNGCVEIELKSGYNKQTPAQIEWEKRSRELGIPYYVCRNLSELQSALEREKLI